jgi:capsule polysaccharide export protein KpsE/RkpR
VLELLQAAEAEIDAAVNEAFAEGYKAAMLEYAPELTALRIRESALRMELDRERKKNRFFWPVTGASFAAGYLINFLISR